MSVRYLSSAWRVYFIVSSKRGLASISVDHPAGGQSLMVPVHPFDAVPDVLPHLEPAFAHYVAQWERIRVDDPAETDANGFFVEAATLPARIADPAHAPLLREITGRHVPREVREYWGDHWEALFTIERAPRDSNSDELCLSAEEAGIEPFPG